MFCYQCQEAAKGTGCEVIGVCGKKEDVAKLVCSGVLPVKRTIKNNKIFLSPARYRLAIFLCCQSIVIMVCHGCHYI